MRASINSINVAIVADPIAPPPPSRDEVFPPEAGVALLTR